jgi:excisionase family DNA binding protein
VRSRSSRPSRSYNPLCGREVEKHFDGHIYALIANGTIRAKRLGKLIRIPASVVETFEETDEWPASESSTGATRDTSSGPKDEPVVEFRQVRAIAKKPSGR